MCSLDFSEDPYLDEEDNCDNCYSSDDLEIWHCGSLLVYVCIIAQSQSPVNL